VTTTAKRLRFNTKEVLQTISRGEEVTITLRGKPYAKLIPIKLKKTKISEKNDLFGIWSDNNKTKEVLQYVRKIRKSRIKNAD
jgi:prevent-host-death family protein